MKMLYFLSGIIYLLHPLRADITYPEISSTNLREPTDEFWQDQGNWPESLENMGITYKLVVFVNDEGLTSNHSSFKKLRGSEQTVTAYYTANAEELSLVKDHNSGQFKYGPHFIWRDGNLFTKGFAYEDGSWDHKQFDNMGRIWLRSVSIPINNEAFTWLYDENGDLVAYRRTAYDISEPYYGNSYAEIQGKEVAIDKFNLFWNNFSHERLSTSSD